MSEIKEIRMNEIEKKRELIDQCYVSFGRDCIWEMAGCSWDDKDNDEIMEAIEEEFAEIVFGYDGEGTVIECVQRICDKIKNKIVFDDEDEEV